MTKEIPDTPADAGVEQLAERPGHWDTSDGFELATRFIGMPREKLPHGEMTDFALANRQFMADRSDLDLITWQQAAKDRIRWLSVQLAAALRHQPARTDEVERLREALAWIAEEHDAGRHDGIPEPCPAHDADEMWAVARAALHPASAPETPAAGMGEVERIRALVSGKITSMTLGDDGSPEQAEAFKQGWASAMRLVAQTLTPDPARDAD